MRKMILTVVLLSLACSSSLAAISQRDLRSIFVHHQEFCRETVQRPAIGVAGETVQFRTSHSIQACKTSLDHEWHINEANILDEAEFQTQLKHRRRQLTDSTTHRGHVYLARIAPNVLVSSELRTKIQIKLGITFDEYFKAIEDNREYFLLYSSSEDEVGALEKETEIDEIIPLPFDWKLSPLLLGDDGFDEDNQADADAASETTMTSSTTYKTLQLHISPRAKKLMKESATGTTMVTLARQMLQQIQKDDPVKWKGVVVQSAGAEASGHFDSLKTAQKHEEESEWMVVSNIPSMYRNDMATLVSTFATVIRVEPMLLHTTSNAWARWVTQSYLGATTDTTKDIATLQRTTIWNRGIQGQGQVVAVGDSGLAHKNCLFDEPGKTITVQTGATYNDPTHRKVVQYVAFADNVAGEARDHGTHVSGSVAGNALQGGTLGEYDGMAPKAKLAFFDIGQAGARGLSVPNDLARNMFPIAYTAGARIHTNSWGSNTAQYTSTARSCDQFMFDNQDFLVLVAAGNSGGQGPGSVGSPASGKSVLSVGASYGTASSFSQNGNQPEQICDVVGEPCTESMASFSSLGPLPADQRLKPETSAPGALTWSAMSNAADQYTCPTTPNAILSDVERNNLVFATQGTSMATPTTAGNAALIRQYFVDGWYPLGLTPAGGENGMNPLGSLVKAVLMNSAKPMNGEHGAQNLGGKTAANTPPSATGLSRSTPTYAQHNLMGFGLTILDRTLFFADTATGPAQNTPADHDLFAVGEFGPNMIATSMKQGDVPKVYRFQVKSGTPFKVTLAWSDAPGSTAAQKALVNNLDLEVREAGPNGGDPAGPPATGTRHVVNGFENSETDDINPFEQVIVYQPTDQWYEVKVVAAQIVTPHPETQGQPFALVVTGKFTKSSELYPGATPILQANSGQKVIIGKKNRWVMLGQKFANTGNEVTLTCQGALRKG